MSTRRWGLFLSMPVVLCKNKRLDHNGRSKRCDKVLGEISPTMVDAMRNDPSLFVTFRCSACKWIRIFARDGRIVFDGDIYEPDYTVALYYDDVRQREQAA